MGLDGYITFMGNKDIPLWVKIGVHILVIAMIVGMYLLTKTSTDAIEKNMAMAAAATVLVTKGGYFSKGVRSMLR
jgi:hypothetical protein